MTAPRKTTPRVPKKQSQPVIIRSDVRQHHNGMTDRRRRCIVCVEPIGDAPKTLTNYKGDIGMAHKVCESRAEV